MRQLASQIRGLRKRIKEAKTAEERLRLECDLKTCEMELAFLEFQQQHLPKGH
jgi:uncharacterized heparinase superfamily protein